MTNLEFITMIEKLHKADDDSNWKFPAFLIGLGLVATIYFLSQSTRKKGILISQQLSDIETAKKANRSLGFINSQLTQEQANQQTIIENLKRDKQALINKMNEAQEKKPEA